MVDTYLRSIEALPHSRSRAAPFDVCIYEGANAVEEAASAWCSLEAVAGTTAFQSLSIARAAALAHIARSEQPRIVVVREKGRPVVVFPTAICWLAGVATVRFLGDPLIQYGDALISPDAKPAHLSAALSAAVDSQTAHLGMLRRVRTDSRLTSLLADRASVIGTDEAPFVDFSNGKMLDARYARETRRLRRRMAERGPVVLEIKQGASAVGILMETLSLKRAWLLERGLPSAVLGNTDWEEVLFAVATMSPAPLALAAARLTIDGKTAATEIGFTDDSTWYAYIAALVPEFAKYGPGRVLMDDILAWCGKTNRAVYDLLPPSQSYKHAIATGSMPVRDYAISFGPIGQAAALAARALPMLKRSIATIPLGFRQKMLRFYLNFATG